ncbi:uncharacterized protein LOC133842894 isoform X1 [Drosophila sulfurigaster albostrigata]|uniref:uncharacterized protein LOC133842894 isoform X1 n=1 Tax=Drosophila sulfurigaster albostrigata TaxID=89887 RepID=UPI002D218D26|nr:uncharacterized protein LOC133842894 isoform X1 [Drosophila sulfurigaster albostrigata]
MAARSVYITNEIIITAMDRFVWFVLLVVMTHLVTEFTRVTGYARGQRQELVLLNDTMLHPMPVQNMLLYPSYEHAHYDQQQAAAGAVSGNSIQQNAAMVLSSLGVGGVGTGAGASSSNTAGNNAAEPSYPFFSLRPLIDSIFEIPISTLRAVNNLVGRLTGSYRQAPEAVQKSVTINAEAPIRLPTGNSMTVPSNLKLSTTGNAAQRQPMREELA